MSAIISFTKIEGDHVEGAVADLMDASDEEPVSVLSRFISGIK